MIQFALLALLQSGPDYGYRLRHRFHREVGPAWCLNVGQVYQALQTLERKGLVAEITPSLAPRDGGGPGRNRRTFAITEKGERSLERWLRRVPTRPRPLRDEILLRLLAASRRDEATIRQVIGASERAHRDRRDRALAERHRAREMGTDLGRLGLDAEIARLDSHLAWLECCRETLLDPASAETVRKPPPPVPAPREARPPAPREARPPERAHPETGALPSGALTSLREQ